MLSRECIDTTLAICELTSEFDRLEGSLLAAGGEDNPVSPGWLADQTTLTETECENILLQLRRIDAVDRIQAEDSYYSVNTGRLRDCFSMARKAVPIVDQIEERRPETTDVTPLVTLPADPSFSSVTPTRFGMEWLMPSLGRLIKQAENEIIILNPFFEKDGFQQLHQPLLNALGNNVEVKIITRYLHDPSSHNRSVVEEFTDICRERGIPLQNLTLLDYTIWDEETDITDQKQDGENPKFTLHAKLLIADQTRAYLGSANVTDYGFERYLEIGAILDGPVVASYRELVEFLLESDAASECHL